MSVSERHFDYKPPTGMLKLLGVLMVILGPFAVAQSFSGDVKEVKIRSPKLMLTVDGPMAPWVLGAAGVALVVFGVVLVRAAYAQDKSGGIIVLKPHGFLLSGSKTPRSGSAISYQKISKLKITEKGGVGRLTFQHPGGKVSITSRQMASVNDFRDMSEQLQLRLQDISEIQSIESV